MRYKHYRIRRCYESFLQRVGFFVLITLIIGHFNTCVYAKDAASGKIAPGERLTIKVLEQNELNGVYTVSSNNTIEFPLIADPVKTSDLTYNQLAAKIKEKLEKDYFYNATVIVTSYQTHSMYTKSNKSETGVVYVYGKVNSPGMVKIPKDTQLTVSKIIIMCGGFTEFADKKKVKLVRRTAGTNDTQTVVLDMTRIIDKGKIEEDVPVRDDDMIVVPEKFFNF